ncbi:hypothetical protein GCM10023238_02980 [Streptomyces heliomycini]
MEHCTYHGPYREAVIRSLITLKALTVRPHRRHRGRAHHLTAGGHRRRPQLGLPLHLAAGRGDHPVLAAAHGYREEARAWREWLLRAVAGDPENLQIMYGIAGERELGEGGAGLGCPATRTPPRSGWATARRTSSSWTCTARSPRPCTWPT